MVRLLVALGAGGLGGFPAPSNGLSALSDGFPALSDGFPALFLSDGFSVLPDGFPVFSDGFSVLADSFPVWLDGFPALSDGVPVLPELAWLTFWRSSKLSFLRAGNELLSLCFDWLTLVVESDSTRCSVSLQIVS